MDSLLFCDPIVMVISFTFQPFSWCSYCYLFFCPKCKCYEKKTNARCWP